MCGPRVWTYVKVGSCALPFIQTLNAEVHWLDQPTMAMEDREQVLVSLAE